MVDNFLRVLLVTFHVVYLPYYPLFSLNSFWRQRDLISYPVTRRRQTLTRASRGT